MSIHLCVHVWIARQQIPMLYKCLPSFLLSSFGGILMHRLGIVKQFNIYFFSFSSHKSTLFTLAATVHSRVADLRAQYSINTQQSGRFARTIQHQHTAEWQICAHSTA